MSAAREALVTEVLAQLDAGGEDAAALRAAMASTLRKVGGIDAALMGVAEASTDEVQRDLVAALTDLSATFDEFGWMLKELPKSLASIQRQLTAQRVEQRRHAALTSQSLAAITGLREEVAMLAESVPGVADPHETQGDQATSPERDCPYRGLLTFQVEDAQWFFGREHLTATFVSSLAERLSGPSILMLVGPSGSGKSSLLRAGLLSALQRGALPVSGSARWPQLLLTPGARPLTELALRAGSLLGYELAAADLMADPALLGKVIRAAPIVDGGHARVRHGAPASRLMIVVDQFEELFTLCEDEREREAFVAALGLAARYSSEPGDSDYPPAVVVLGIRADFYARCTAYPDLVPLLQEHQLVVGPMSVSELRRTIERPSAAAGLILEPGLVELILRDLGVDPTSRDSDSNTYEPGALPLLSHALLATWQQRQDSTRLTVDGYNSIGGIHRAVAETAENVYTVLDRDGQTIARRMLLQMVSLGEESEDARRRVNRRSLLARFPANMAATVEAVLDRLVRARLVTLDDETAELAHEAVFRAWPRLRRWLAEDRAGLQTHRHLTHAAQDWDRLGRDPGVLYRGKRLATAQAWATDHEHDLSTLEREFLDASTATEQRESRESALARRFATLSEAAGGAGPHDPAIDSILALLEAKASHITKREQPGKDVQTVLVVPEELQRERRAAVVLSRAAAKLFGAPSRDALHERSLDAVITLLESLPEVHAAIWEGTTEEMTAVAVKGHHAEKTAGRWVIVRNMPEPLRSALRDGQPASAEGADAARWARGFAFGATRNAGAVSIQPLVRRSELRSVLVVISAAPIPDDLRDALEELSTQIALVGELRQGERRFRSLVQNSSDVVTVVGPDATIRYVSPSVERVFGYKPAELRGVWLDDLAHLDDRAALLGYLYTVARQPTANDAVQWRWRDPNGVYRDVETVGTNLVHMPDVGGVVLNTRDVSERKALERTLAQLLDKTTRGAEDERTHLAAELHDGPIQRLTTTGYELARAHRWLERSNPAKAKDILESSQQQLSVEIDTLRVLSSRLRPPILDEQGVAAALTEHIKWWEARHEVKTELAASLDRRLDPEVETTLFRVTQEALANVAKHANAQNLWVTLDTDDSAVYLKIRDNGVGFAVADIPRLTSEGRYGLAGMRQRVEMAGGQWSVDSDPDIGTSITVRFNLAEESEP